MMKLRNMMTSLITMRLEGFSVADLKREDGQTLAEYALILALIAAAVSGALIFLRGDITSLFSKIGSDL
jgi:Flp pilus assembly pilin Flp